MHADDPIKIVAKTDTDPGAIRRAEHFASEVVLIDAGYEPRLSRADLGISEVELRRGRRKTLRVGSRRRARVVAMHRCRRGRWRREIFLVLVVFLGAAMTAMRVGTLALTGVMAVVVVVVVPSPRG